MSGPSASGPVCPGAGAAALLPFDDWAGQCAHAANYIEAHPGRMLAELGAGADLGSATKVLSEMLRAGYRVRKVRESMACVAGTRRWRGMLRLFLEARPDTAQRDLFPIE